MRNKFFYLVILQLLLFSCQNDSLEPITPSLPGGGPLFEVISTYPGWQSDWNELNTAGIPLPDDALKVSGFLQKGYYIVPVTNGMEITHLALYPLVGTEGGKTVTSSPVVVGRGEIEANALVQNFLKAGLFHSWEEKGYTLGFQQSDGVAAPVALPTRSGGMGIEGYHTIYFDIFLFYGHAYEDRNVELYTLSQWKSRYVDWLGSNNIGWELEDDFIMLSFPVESYTFDAACEKYRRLLDDIMDDLRSEFPLLELAINQGPKYEAIPPGEGGGGGGSGSGGDGSIQSGKDALEVVNRPGDSNLNELEKLELEEAFEELIGKYPEICQLLETWTGGKISFYVGELKTPEGRAEYDPVDRTITFSEENGIKADYLREELLHAAQHNMYGDNMKDAARNIEFEVKVFQDLMGLNNGELGGKMGISDLDLYLPSYIDSYNNFINDMIIWQKPFDIDTYNELYQGWKGYEGKPGSSVFDPKLIQNYF